jgi:lipopolysaccharide transport system permease protein
VTSPDHPTVIIRPRHGWVALSLVDLWRYRELLFILAWRDIKVRYKQTFLGVLWAVIQPFVAMVVFSIFFGKLAKMPSDGIPYPVFVYCGLLPWQLFARAMTESAGSVTGNQALITKVFFHGF